MNTSFIITPEEAGQRLDLFCVSKMPEYSRATIQKAIQNGEITADGKEVKRRHMLQAGQTIAIALKAKEKKIIETSTLPEIPVIYEDKNIVVINKPWGVAVHAGVGTGATIVDWLLEKYPNIKNVGDHIEGEENIRPGIVHRLDKETSGALLIAKTQPAFEHFKEQFKRQQVKKQYLALVFGVLGEEKGRIVRPLARSKNNPLRRTIVADGKEAITEWKKERAYKGKYTLLRVFPLTGRTHQIRVHMHFLGFPIVGDRLYIFKRQKQPLGVQRHLLHAEILTIMLQNGERKTFQAPLAEDFQKVLDSLSDNAV